MQKSWDEKAVFLRAAGLPVAEREPYLRSACPDEPAVQRVLALLRHHAQGTGGFAVAPAGLRAHPERIDEFRIVRLLGEGSMGVVYEAEDTTLQRRVAVKVLPPHLADSESAIARFRQEARTAAGLNHPGIVPVYKLGTFEGLCYIVTEYVEGPTLARVIEDEVKRRSSHGTLDGAAWRKRSAEIVAALAEALEIAHRAGIVHRDVKPSNILMDPARGPRLTDFGIALPAATQPADEPQAIVGSIPYMSPEQARAAIEPIDARSDIFSAGVVLYELLTLKRPFEGVNAQGTIHAILHSDPAPPRRLDSKIHVDLETACLTALEKDPSRRYQTSGQFAADLRAYLSGRPIMARPPSVARRASAWVWKHRRAHLVALLALLLTLSAWLWNDLRRARDAADGWLTVHVGVKDARVGVSRQSAATLQFERADPREQPPGVITRRSPGLYRVAATAPDGSFAESHVLLDPGREHARSITLRPLPSSDERFDDMILIPAGDYVVGFDEGPSPLTRRRTVRVESFLIDRFEVTNGEYAAFVRETGHPYVEGRLRVYERPEFADLPVINVTWDDAEAFARFYGKRLPTMIEWQAAARGRDGRIYPWGESINQAPLDPAPSDAMVRSMQSTELEQMLRTYAQFARPARSADEFPGPFGVSHLFGNVREYTATIDFSLRAAVSMGRCWGDPVDAEGLASPHTLPVSTSSMRGGFRCARSASASLDVQK